jgi:type I restriction enzyme S subunit
MSSKTKTTATKEEATPALVPKLRFPEFRGAGEWKTETLGSVAKISTEKVGENTCIPMSITSGVGLVSQMEKFGRIIAGSSYANYLLLKKNDFAYNKSATKEYPEGFIALYSGDELAAVPNSIFTCFRIKGDSPVPQYLNYLLLGNLHGRWLRNFIEVGARAHGSLSIDEDDLLALPVPLPSGKASIPEQQKIAECLSSVDELIAAQARKLDALKTHKKGLMQQLFPREGETQPRLRFPEFQNAGEWVEQPLGQLIEVASGQVDPKQPPYCDSPQIGSENIESHSGKLVNVKSAGDKGVISGNYAFDENDILYSKIRPALNKVAAPAFKGICSADIYPIRPADGSLLRSYLFYLLLSQEFLDYAIRNSERGKIPKINRDALVTYKALIPSPDEQQRIADCLTSLDDLIAAQTQKHEALKTHKKGLMQQLFPSPEEPTNL